MSNLPVNSLQSNDLKLPSATIVDKPLDKAQIFSEVFNKHLPDALNQNEPNRLEKKMKKMINRSLKKPNNLYDQPITQNEISAVLSELKPTTMDDDLIHNTMLKNLNKANQRNLAFMLNISFGKTYVPAKWRKSTICPILKPNAPRTQTRTAQLR